VTLGLGVLLFAIVAESVSLWGCMREVNKERHGRNLVRWFRESRSSELIVVFGEDIAALAGLVLAFLAVGLTKLTGNPLWDAIGTLGIGALLIAVAFFIAIEVKALLIGQSADPLTLRQMRQFLAERPEVEHVYSLLTLHFGPDVMAAIKARMAPQDSDQDLVKAINTVEAAFRARFDSVRWLFFEPDIHD
jgi:divalent metal cation (Fe/Co/Zn/Cd) transporter